MSYYKDFSYYFDEIMSEVDYNLWIDFAKKHIKKEDSILDLACGSGTFAIFLSLLGYKISGSDLSSDMINVAIEKAKINRSNINFFVSDMTSFKSDKYDVITCFFDSINHLETYEDVKNTFTSVYNNLNDGGLFIFDVFSLYALKHCKSKRKGKNEEFSYVWKTKKISKDSLRHNIKIKTQDSVIKESYTEYYYNIAEDINKYFTIENITSDFTDELNEYSGRLLYVLKKKDSKKQKCRK